mgnify:CR=1 FL=1
MKKNSALYIVLGVLVLCIALTLVFLFPNNGRFYWNESYGKEEQPYDIDIIYELLDGEKDRIENVNEDPLVFLDSLYDMSVSSSYIFFHNQNEKIDSSRLEKLLDYAEKGNDVLFITKNPPRYFLEKTFSDISDADDLSLDTDSILFSSVKYQSLNLLKSKVDSTVLASLVVDKGEKPYEYTAMDRFGPKSRFWFYLDTIHFCNLGDKVEVLGTIKSDEVNFFKVSVGKGHVFVHSNPILFTNHSLLSNDAFAYSNKVFSNINTEKIYWSDWSYEYSNNRPNNSLISESPLRVFLEETSFKWAWYFLLVVLLLFIVFRAKRERPPVAVIEQNRNTSIEYVEAIVNLYFNKKEHHLVLKQLMQQWHAYIRKRYGVNEKIYSKEENFVKAVVSHSGVSKEELEPILEYYRNNFDKKTTVSFQELVSFYGLTESFYKKSK